MNPRFSVIIPTYNREELVGATLDSVFAQELDDYEVIVVDDGSTDGTLDVVRGYGERVRVFKQLENRGCAAARNRGAAEAQGEYLAFLDSDDFWFSWTLAVFDQAIREGRSPAFIAGRLSVFEDEADLRDVRREEPQIVTGEDYLAVSVRERFFLGVAHGVVRREDYLAVGGCAEVNVNATDSDVLLKLGDRPGCALIRQPATLAYRRHTGRTTTNFEKALAGVHLLLEQEAQGAYPGGAARKHERHANIAARARGVTAGMMKAGRADLAWLLYKQTFTMNARQGRLRYLLGMPVSAVWSLLRGNGSR